MIVLDFQKHNLPMIYLEKELNWLVEDGIAEEMLCFILHKVLRFALQKLQFTFRLGILPKDYQLVHIEIPDEDF